MQGEVREAPPEPMIRRGSTEGADCASCPFAKNGAPRAPVVSEIPLEDDPAWIVVGEGPGSVETSTGKPFMGETGRLVNRAIKTVKRDRRTLAIMNATACQPTPGSDDKARHKAALCCAPRLRRELAELPPAPILALGAVAARVLLPTRLKGITQITGTWHRVDVDGSGRERDVIPTIHPAAILRAGGAVKGAHTSEMGFWSFLFDVAKAEALATGKARRLPVEVIRTEVLDPARASKLIGEIYVRALREGAFSLDLETFVDDPDRHDARQTFAARIDTLGLATLDYAISVRYELLDRGARNLLATLLRNERVAVITQNGILYDRPVLMNDYHRYACHENWHDTMIMHHGAFPGMPKNLQAIVTQFFLVSPWKSEYRENKKVADEDSPEERAAYNARDVLGTRLIKPALEVWIRRKAVDRVYEQDRAVAFVAAQMGRRGKPIDREVNRELDHVMSTVVEEEEVKLHEAIETRREEFWDKLAILQAGTRRKGDATDFRERVAARMAELVKAAGSKKGWRFNPHANLQVAALLQLGGANLAKRTKKGQIATGAEVLEKFSSLPLVSDLARWGENEKILGTFIRPMFDREVEGKPSYGWAQWREDHFRIYPSWSTTKITARWGAAMPLAQNWTKGDKFLCPTCRKTVAIVGFDAYWHPPNAAKPCPNTGRVMGRSEILMTGSKIPNVRFQIRARPGWKLVGFDYGQQEARALGYLSDDPWLCSVFEAGKDIHAEFGGVVWKDYWQIEPEVRSKRRDNIKNAEFAAFYKGSEDAVLKTLQVNFPETTIAQVRLMLSLMTEKLGRLHQWQAEMLAATNHSHEIRDPMIGRLRCFPLGMHAPTEIANWPIQHFGAWLMAQGLLRMRPKIERYRDDAFWIGQYHDAAMFEVREDLAERVAADSKSSFEIDLTTKSGRQVPFPVDVKIDDTWAMV